MISLNQWLKKFNVDKKITKTQFKEFTVTYKKPLKLKTFIGSKITSTQFNILYNNLIGRRREYLTNFYNRTLKIKDPKSLHLIPKQTLKSIIKRNTIMNRSNQQYKNIIRNYHWKDIFKDTKSSISVKENLFTVLDNIYNHNKLNYQILSPFFVKSLEKGHSLGSLFSGIYFRASVFNPYMLRSIFEHLIPGEKLLMPTLGWNSYLYAWLSSENTTEAVGIDVIPSVCKTSKKISTLFPNKKVKIFCKPSEEIAKTKTFLNKYTKYFDTVFFSPPYYDYELYKSKNQSTTSYKTYNEWLNKYWKPTVELSYHSLKSSGKMGFIISPIVNKQNIYKDMDKIVKDIGFKSNKKYKLLSNNVSFTKHRDNTETLYIYTK